MDKEELQQIYLMREEAIAEEQSVNKTTGAAHQAFAQAVCELIGRRPETGEAIRCAFGDILIVLVGTGEEIPFVQTFPLLVIT